MQMCRDSDHNKIHTESSWANSSGEPWARTEEGREFLAIAASAAALELPNTAVIWIFGWVRRYGR
jgi:hypothetical protein